MFDPQTEPMHVGYLFPISLQPDYQTERNDGWKGDCLRLSNACSPNHHCPVRDGKGSIRQQRRE